jgi:hypothetical protein
MCVGDDESPLGNAFIASETLIVGFSLDVLSEGRDPISV